ncbi:MAG: SpvB/TcaC N-terminal domain-containing protein [Pseudomonadota bacterium]
MDKNKIKTLLKTLALLTMTGWVAWGVHAALTVSQTLKSHPTRIEVTPDGSLPPETQALERATAGQAFDRDTTTEYTAFGPARLTASLEAAAELSAIKVFGGAPYTLNVFAEANGAWRAVEGLQALDLSKLADVWHRFDATTTLTAQRVRFDLTPVVVKGAKKNTLTGLKELEIWVAGARASQAPIGAWVDALDKNQAPAQVKQYAATLKQGVIGPVTLPKGAPMLPDNANDNTFKLAITQDPRAFKHAWLVYEAHGIAQWVSAVRSINNQVRQGGSLTFVSQTWARQIEPINPLWLVQGDNSIGFAVPDGQTGNYGVKNVRIVAELDTGANFISRISAANDDPSRPVASLLDGNTATGWRPYGGTAASPAAKTAVEMVFDNTLQLDSVEFYLTGVLEGNLSVDRLIDGAWRTGGGALQARKLVAGWNSLPVDTSAIQGLRLNFGGGAGSHGEIGEIMLTGSNVGAAIANGLHITYPEQGEYYGRTAHVRGYLTLSDNGSGPSKLTLGGKSVKHDQGAFEATLSKNDVGLRHQANATPWALEVKAVYPDGETHTQIVHLNQAKHENAGRDRLRMLYAMAIAGLSDQSLDYDGAQLEVGSGAVDSEVTLAVESLQANQVPQLDPGMSNVTKGPRRGYRFTPHGMKFKKAVLVKLPYDKKLIPKGLAEEDVKTFYYDDQAGRWKALERVQVDTNRHIIISRTDHFTDMINGTIVVPEHPQVADFNPTSIKDIKAADPGAGINLIEPPKASNMGDANLNYPLELPPGRNGMQPQLAIAYNSGGGNGWLGLGWDLSIPSVSVETRWGVPRYNTAKETETYALEGKMLTPVAHRGQIRDRQRGNVRFYPRVETEFKKIIRHGDAPGNYWWETIDKSGKKHFYGGDGTQVDLAATLSAVSPNTGNRVIAKWMLRKVVDTNGNTIEYRYATVAHPGIATSTELGTQLYPSEIVYTGHGATAGAYKVRFVRDRQMQLPNRHDISIEARNGFKVVNADLLKRVDIYFSSQLVRSYELVFREGAYRKTLLASVSQLDKDGNAFAKHDFDYYRDAIATDGGYVGFLASKKWDTREDGVKLNLLGTQANASLLSGASGTNSGYGFNLGFGLSADLRIGYNDSSDSGETDGILTMVDIDGDGLPDKVYKNAAGVFYRPNTAKPGTNPANIKFGEARPVIGLSSISHTENSSSSHRGDITYGAGQVYRGSGNSFTTEKFYFADINGDGLVDAVDNGRVLFNHIDSAGNPTFTANSYDTPVPLGAGGSVSDMLPDYSEQKNQMLIANPRLDAVRVWIAPYDGEIAVSGAVALVRDTSDARAKYTTADGVRVAIQNGVQELWSARINANDYAPHAPTGVNALKIVKNDRLYFRVQSVFDGAYDNVSWAPQVTYKNIDSHLRDANALKYASYNAALDFSFAGRQANFSAPYKGTLTLRGKFVKNRVTTDDVRIVLSVKEPPSDATPNPPTVRTVMGSLAHAVIGDLNIDYSFAVTKGNYIGIKVELDSPVDLAAFAWAPELYYTYAEAEAAQPTDQDGNPLLDANGNPINVPKQVLPVTAVVDGVTAYTMQMPANYAMDTYPETGFNTPALAWSAPQDGVVMMLPKLVQSAPLPDFKYLDTLSSTEKMFWISYWKAYQTHRPLYPASTPYFTLKRTGIRENKLAIPISGGEQPKPMTLATFAHVAANDQVFIEYNTNDLALAKFISPLPVFAPGNLPPYPYYLPPTVQWAYGSNTAWTAPFNGRFHFTSTVVRTELSNVSSGALLFVVRRGKEFLFKKLIEVSTANAIELPSLDLDVAENDGLIFEMYVDDASLAASFKALEVKANYANTAYWRAPKTGHISISPDIHFTTDRGVPNGSGWMAVVSNGTTMVGSVSFWEINGQLYFPSEYAMSWDVSEGENLTFHVFSDEPAVASAMTTMGAQIAYYTVDEEGNVTSVETALAHTGASLEVRKLPTFIQAQFATLEPAFNRAAPSQLLPQPYRGWAMFAYNGEESRADAPINAAYLKLPESKEESQQTKQYAYPAVPHPRSGRWRSSDEGWWVAGGDISASRLGKDFISVPEAKDFTLATVSGVAGAVRLPRTSVGQSNDYGAGFFLTYNSNSNSGQGYVDTLDMNGDQFPDILAVGNIRYTLPTGDVAGENATLPGGASLRSSSGTGYSFSSGASQMVGAISALGRMTETGNGGSSKSAPGGSPANGTNPEPTKSLSLSGSYGGTASQDVTGFMDMNGDGLPDFVVDGNGVLAVSLNKGYGQFGAPEVWNGGTLGRSHSVSGGGGGSWGTPSGSVSGGVGLNYSENHTARSMMDINNDGLPDEVHMSGTTVMVRFNNGTGFDGEVAWPNAVADKLTFNRSLSASGNVGGIYHIPLPIIVIGPTIGASANKGKTLSRQEVALRDVNGDGVVDSVFSDNEKELKVALSAHRRTHLLKSVHRPLGATIELDYARSGNTYAQPHGKWVLSQVTVHDGVADDGPDQVTKFTYTAGQYDRYERDFYGYGKVVETPLDGTGAAVRSHVRGYRTDNYYAKGLQTLEEVRTGDAHDPVLRRTTSHYDLIAADTQAPATLYATGDPAEQRVFPALTRTDKDTYEGSAALTTYTTHTYDVYGNVTHFFDAGDTDSADDIEADIHYDIRPDTHLVALPTQIIIQSNGRALRRRSATYDARGNLIEVHQALDGGIDVRTDLVYNDYGNLTGVTGPANATGQRYQLEFTYDSVVQGYVERIDDKSFGYSSSATYDYALGKLNDTTDRNGNRIRYVYDSVGRTHAITGPYQQGGTQATLRFDYHPEATVPYAITRHYDPYRDPSGSDTLDTVLFTDGLKRVLQTKKDHAQHRPGQPPQVGMSVSGRVHFDALGRSIAQYYPRFEAAGLAGVFNATFDRITPTLTDYDALDRPTQTILPDGATTRMDYRIEAVGGPAGHTPRQATLVTDALGHTKVTYKDQNDLITAVQEINAGQAILTRYAYDPLKQLTQVIDAQGHVTRVTYDSLGRRTAIDNPDTGRIDMVYDPMGNLVKKTTPNLRQRGADAIEYAYDVNRLTAIHTPNRPANDVTYTYGPPNAPHNRAGRIVTLTHQAGKEERFYGKLGERIKEIKHLPITQTGGQGGASSNEVEIFTLLYEYDSFGRLQRLVYPDGDQLHYDYDAGGSVARIHGSKDGVQTDYVTRIEYDEFGQRKYVEFPNGVTTAYRYDAKRRYLENLVSKGQTQFQNLNYQFDKVGNIVSRSNTVPTADGFLGQSQQSYGYDDLYRLTHASGSVHIDSTTVDNYTLSIHYDAIHNVTVQSSPF